MSEKETLLTNEDILCFGISNWDFIWHPDKHTMLELSKNNRVVYVEPVTSFLAPLRTKQPWKMFVNLSFNIKKINDNFYVCSHPPVFLPFPAYSSIFPKINAVLFSRLFKRGLKKLNFKKPIVWSFMHHYEGSYLVPEIEHKLFIYDCIDEYSSFTNNVRSKNYIRQVDKSLCERADIVFTVSQSLLDTKKKYNAHTYKIPNAVNLSHFAKNAPVPNDIADIKPPIVGFIGMIDFERNTDLDVLRHLAQNHPEFSLVLIGPLEHEPDSDFKNLSNVHFLGRKRVEELSNYIKKFDVCLMPYLINEFSAFNCPQKLYEYFALGKPVVTTKIPGCEEFEDIIWISRTCEEFAQNVCRALKDDDREKALRRIKLAQQSTWEKRVAEKSHLVKERLTSYEQ